MERELNWDTRVSHTELGVQVTKGVVTLTGTVDSWDNVRAAEKAAHRVAGVLDVANDLVVKLPGSTGETDTELAQAVRHVLEWDTLVPDKEVQTTVSHGSVTLDGRVSYWTQRSDAERAIERLAGVKRVINRIEVKLEGARQRRGSSQGGREGARAPRRPRGGAHRPARH